MPSSSLLKLRAGATLVRLLPLPFAIRLGEFLASRFGPRLAPSKALQLRRHLERITSAESRPGVRSDLASSSRSGSDLDALVAQGFGSYGRYWVESFRLPYLKADAIGAEFEVDGLQNIYTVLESGVGPILVMPHIGGWEWAAGWLTRCAKLRVSAVVERLEPDDVFEWFIGLRRAYGVNVIPLGPKAMGGLVKSVKEQEIACLMADRDVAGNGVEVVFFGEKTSLPIGPALLSRRTGAPLLPTAVFYNGSGYIAEVGEPIYPEWGDNLRSDLQTVTQQMAEHLERLIMGAPEQWHVLEPNWPSDRG